MAFECMFCLLNCSGESTTHLVEEVQLIQPLQVTTATNLLVKMSTKPESGPEHEKSAAAPLRHQISPRLQTYGSFSRESWRSATAKLQSLEGRTS